METVKEMAINREPSEEASCKKECLDIIIVAMAVVATLVEVIITSKVTQEGCNHKCRVAIMEEAEEASITEAAVISEEAEEGLFHFSF